MLKNIYDYTTFINEIFSSEKIYDVILKETKKTSFKKYNPNYLDITNYRYSFTTKDDVIYDISLEISENGEARIDFLTNSKNKEHSSIISLINTYDTIRVMNTLKSIIDKHKEIEKLIISSSKDRMVFYKKLLDYFKIKNIYNSEDECLIAYLK